MKKLVHVLLILMLMLPVFIMNPATTVNSAPTVYFVAVDDTLFPLNKNYMPIMYRGVVYIPHTLLYDAEMGVFYIASKPDGNPQLYNAQHKLTFNIDMGVAYDDVNVYSRPAVELGDRIYFPASFVCAQFGLSYTYYPDLDVVRITTGNYKYGSATFEAMIRQQVKTMRDEYLGIPAATAIPSAPATAAPSAPASPSPSPGPSPGTIYLSFRDGPQISGVLDALDRYGVPATFFLPADRLKERTDELRRMEISGCGIGLIAKPGSAMSDLAAGNELLSGILFFKTRVMSFSQDSQIPRQELSELSLSGYRVWLNAASSDGAMSASLVRNTLSSLRRDGRTAVLTLSCDAATAGELPGVLEYMRREGFKLRVISETETPVDLVISG